MANVKFYRMNSKETFEAELLKESFDENGLYFVMSEVPEFFLGRRRISINDDIQHAVKAQLLGVEGSEDYAVDYVNSTLRLRRISDSTITEIKLGEGSAIVHSISADSIVSFDIDDYDDTKNEPYKESGVACKSLKNGNTTIKLIYDETPNGVACTESCVDITKESGLTKRVKLGDYFYTVEYDSNNVPTKLVVEGGWINTESGTGANEETGTWITDPTAYPPSHGFVNSKTINIVIGEPFTCNPCPDTSKSYVGQGIQYYRVYQIANRFYCIKQFQQDPRHNWRGGNSYADIVNGSFTYNKVSYDIDPQSNSAISYTGTYPTEITFDLIDVFTGKSKIITGDSQIRTNPGSTGGVWGNPEGTTDASRLGYFSYLSDSFDGSQTGPGTVNPLGNYSLTKIQGIGLKTITGKTVNLLEMVSRGFKIGLHPEVSYGKDSSGKDIIFNNIGGRDGTTEGYIQVVSGRDATTKKIRVFYRTIERRFDVVNENNYQKVTSLRAPWSAFTEIGGSDLEVLGITANLEEINALHESGITQSDLIKLHEIGASAEELSKLTGLTVTATDLNALSGIKGNVQSQIDSMKYFSNVQAGGVVLAADSKGDTLVIEAGTNVTIEADTSDTEVDKIIIKSAKYTVSQTNKIITITNDHEPGAPVTLNVGSGAEDTNDKIYLIGAKAQTNNEVSYSNDKVFINEDGSVNSANSESGVSEKVATTSDVSWNEFPTA